VRLQYAGTFRATFLVVTAADYLANDLSNVQRQRWRPELAKSTLDIGCACLMVLGLALGLSRTRAQPAIGTGYRQTVHRQGPTECGMYAAGIAGLAPQR
jgi:hypothetical protein